MTDDLPTPPPCIAGRPSGRPRLETPDAEIVALRRQGMTLHAIVDAINARPDQRVSYSTVWRRCAEIERQSADAIWCESLYRCTGLRPRFWKKYLRAEQRRASRGSEDRRSRGGRVADGERRAG